MTPEQRVIYSKILRHLSGNDYSGAKKFEAGSKVSQHCTAADFADLLMYTENRLLRDRSPAEVALEPGGTFLLNRIRPWE